MAIRIFVTGGTFDRSYDEINGRRVAAASSQVAGDWPGLAN